MNKSYDLILFCQAPADILYVIDIVNSSKFNNCKVYVMNVKSIAEFLSSLKLHNVEVEYLKKIEINLKSIASWFIVKKEINAIWDEYFSEVKDSRIHFFSTSYDFYTASIVSRLSKNLSNKVIYSNHYDHLTSLQGVNKFSILRRLKKYIYEFVTNSKFCDKSDVNFPIFEFSKFGIEKIEIRQKPLLDESLLYLPKSNEGSANHILFFLSPEEVDNLTTSGKMQLESIIKNLKSKGFRLYLKGHPRLGVPKQFDLFFDELLPSYIPSEFIDYTCFEYVIGVWSAALCYPATKNVQVVSLLEKLNFIEPKKIIGFKAYINSYSNNQIIYNYPI